MAGFLPELSCIFTVKICKETSGLSFPEIPQCEVPLERSFFFMIDSMHEPFSNKPPQGLRIRKLEHVKGFETLTFFGEKKAFSDLPTKYFCSVSCKCIVNVSLLKLRPPLPDSSPTPWSRRRWLPLE